MADSVAENVADNVADNVVDKQQAYTGENILLVQVLYRNTLPEATLSLAADFPGLHLFFYDNTPRNTSDIVRIPFGDRTHIVRNPNNPGVSLAYNTAIDYARELGKEAVLLLDQDTSLTKQQLNVYLAALQRFGSNRLIAPLVGRPDYFYSPYAEGWLRNRCLTWRDVPYDAATVSAAVADPSAAVNIEPQLMSLHKRSLINSGLLIPLALTEKIGVYRSEIRLDFSDTSFMNRYRAAFEDIVLLPILLPHHLSGDSGHDEQRELRRYVDYCQGARSMLATDAESHPSVTSRSRICRLVLFRMLRLIFKYRTLKPLAMTWRHFIRGERNSAM